MTSLVTSDKDMPRSSKDGSNFVVCSRKASTKPRPIPVRTVPGDKYNHIHALFWCVGSRNIMENSQFQNPDNGGTSIYDAGVLFVDAPEYYLSDYLLPENIPPAAEQQTMVPMESVGSGSSNPIPTSSNIEYKNRTKKKMERTKSRIAFRIKTELETLDDGFKWRKYGKKMVKTSPNPRYNISFNHL
nr:probable WRKY transcription factor 51 [Ipomoea batatas]